MDSEDEIIDAMFLLICKHKKRKIVHRRKRRWGVRPINKDRVLAGYFKKMFQKIKKLDDEQFFIHTRMSRKIFDLLLTLIGVYLQKPRQIITPEERLSLTILHLAHGISFQNIAWCYKLGKTTVRNIVLETSEILWNVLSPIYVSEPTQSQYIDIAKEFYDMWNIPHCVGAIDGKHVAIKCPKNSGSMYFNYKHYFSIVLMAVCDAKYTFTSVSVGSYGSQSDGGIFRTSPFGKAIISETLPLPPNEQLSNASQEKFPYFFVGDAAFPLRNNLMRPYPGGNMTRTRMIFNYRLSRARRVIENAFGILTARWRVLRTTIECNPDNAEKIILGCIALHNFIMMNDHQRWYLPEKYADWEGPDHIIHNGAWKTDLKEVGGALRSIRTFGRNAAVNIFQNRDRLANYFINEGAVPFQDNMVNAMCGN